MTMKFLPLLLLSSFLQLPVVMLNQEPLMSIVQQVDTAQKARVRGLLTEGVNLFRKSEYPTALDKLQQALVLAEKIRYKEAEGSILGNIGVIYISLNQYPKALEYFQKSLTVSKAIENKTDEGTAFNNIGEAYRFLGKYTNALQNYQQSLAISRVIRNKSGEGITLNNIGLLYEAQAQYPQALEYYQQALIIAKEIQDIALAGNVLGNIGVVYGSLDQYPKALEYFQQSLAIKKAIGDKNGEGNILTNIGGFYLSTGQYPKALKYYQESLAIFKGIRNKSVEGITLSNIGQVYFSQGQYPQALEYYQQSIVISKAISNKSGESNTLNKIGIVYRSLGQYPKALASYQKALAISKVIKDRSIEGNTLSNIGVVYSSQDQYPKALDYYQKSLVIRKEVGDKSGEATTLQNIGAALLTQKKPSLAEQSLREAITIWETIRGSKNSLGQGLSDSDKVAFADLPSVSQTYKLLQIALIQQNKSQSALEISERDRARALVELLASRAVNLSTNTPILPKAPNLAKIQQIAKNQNATLVEYSLIVDTIYIWVVSPNGSIVFQQSKLSPNTNIKDLVNTSRDDIGVRGRNNSGKRATLSAGSAQGDLKLLHKLLIAPIAKSLPKDPNQRIIFIPQGELFFVPFVALQDSNDKYLIEQHTISTASAIGLLDSTPKPAKFNPKQGTSIVVGNPIMPLAPDGTQLVPLDGAEKEAIAIGSILKTTPLIGAQADKNIVINKMRSASIIHLATHGLLDKVKGDIPGAIALTNGLLTSNEIFDLKLQANLVVLSACDTGGGDLSGDGVIGLSRALAAAGTPSVAVSLWSVNDSSTQELMVEFYQNWYGKGMNKDQAMRQAMLEVMKSREKPRDWAAFTILGEAR
jgi:CHAT domain-containing protein/uncharacterized protein HemY